jgi:hypothetical protein
MVKNKEKSLLETLPDKKTLKEWNNLLIDYYGIDFPLEVLKYAYILDSGYRMAMFKFSQFITDKELKEEPYKHAIEHNRTKKFDWIGFETTDFREAILEKATLILIGMEHPCYGDSKEYKEEFEKEISKYRVNTGEE